MIYPAEETADDGLDLRLGVVEMGPHAHHHRLPSIQLFIHFWVCGLDWSCVQDDWAAETEGVRHDQGKVNLEDTGTDRVGCASTGGFHDRCPAWEAMGVAVLVEFRNHWRSSNLPDETDASHDIFREITP